MNLLFVQSSVYSCFVPTENNDVQALSIRGDQKDLSSRISKLECTVYWLIQQPQAMARPISTENLGVDSPSTTSISSRRFLSSIYSSLSCDSIALVDLTNISSPSEESAHRSLIDEMMADKKHDRFQKSTRIN